MATQMSNFKVIASGTVRVQTGGDIDIDLPFDLPDNTPAGSGLLTFTINPALPNNLTYTMSLNGTVVITRTVETNIRYVDHEVVSGVRGGANTLRVLITGGAGGLAFSDIVLHYHRSV
jgi:hypothetical protein